MAGTGLPVILLVHHSFEKKYVKVQGEAERETVGFQPRKL
jgi:hypothetical protein